MKPFELIAIALVFGGLSCAARVTPVVAATDTLEPAPILAVSNPETPATQPAAEAMPALPKGHPDISAMGGGKPALPKGHPDISKIEGGAPAAVPAGRLPSGHPDISKPQTAPTSQPTLGSLTIHAIQGTKGGPTIAGDPVKVEVYNNGQVAGQVDTKLDDKGNVTVSGVPIGEVFQVAVCVSHAGADFSVTPVFAPGVSDQQVDVTVAESTEEAPDWFVHMRHIMAQPGADGLNVIDMVSVQNPSDRAWLGTADASGKRVTFTLPLPAGAKDVQLAGFSDKARFNSGTVTESAALVPGVTQYQLHYSVPLAKGHADFTAVAPAPVNTMMVFFPDDGSKITAIGLEGPQTVNMGNGSTRYFKGENLGAGHEAKLTVDNVAAPVKKSSAARSASYFSGSINGAEIAKAIAGVGAVLIFLFGGALLLIKSPATSKKH